MLHSLPPRSLGQHIQKGNHDSAEDARTAVQLYHKYCELKDSNSLEESLAKLYETGRKCAWQIPES